MGIDVTYSQYMPENPINHGINMFSICCDISAILICFKVYVGQEDDSDNTSLGIFDELVKEAGITSVRGQTLYTNNYYKSMALAKHMFNNYGWKIVGTIVPTDKKSRADHDILFSIFQMDQGMGYN